MGSKATRHTESSKRGAGLLPLAALIFFLLGVPLALAGQGDGGAETASHGKRHSPASKNQLKEKTRELRSDIQTLYEAIGALQRQVQTPSGGPATPSGPAGGALAGTYPDPTLNVSGGPCANGRALTDVSALAALTCAPGVYSDASNVAAGPTSFPALTTGFSNSALGLNALVDNTTGAVNSALGRSSLANNTHGNGNSALGASSLLSNTTGVGNSALGLNSLFSNTTGVGNSALGEGSLQINTTGNDNTALGRFAGSNLTTGSNNIAIGNPGVAGESNTTRIGSVQSRAFIAGISGAMTGVDDAVPVLIDSAGQLGTTSSSRRVKRDIQPLRAPDPLMRLRPVSFRYREGPPELHYGLLAEQVARVLPELAVSGPDGLPETVQYQELPVMLLAKVQDQQREIDRQQRQKDALGAQVRRQQAQIDWLIRRARDR